MKTKTGDIEKRRMREARELVRREKQLRARSGQYYMVYLFMVLSLIYIVDEIASTISIQCRIWEWNMGRVYHFFLHLALLLILSHF